MSPVEELSLKLQVAILRVVSIGVVPTGAPQSFFDTVNQTIDEFITSIERLKSGKVESHTPVPAVQPSAGQRQEQADLGKQRRAGNRQNVVRFERTRPNRDHVVRQGPGGGGGEVSG